MSRPPRIDAHHHVWDPVRRPQPWTDGLPVLQREFSMEELVPQLHAEGVDGTVVVHTLASLAETHELLALAAREPLVAGVVGWFDLTDPALDDVLATARAHAGGRRLVGARHQLQVEPDPQWLTRPEVARGLTCLARHGLAYDVVVSPGQLAMVATVASRLPEVRFVLDHAGKPPIAGGDLADWVRDVRALAAHDNVAVKLSGLVTEASWSGWNADDLRPVVETVLEAWGPDRTMLGSDWPVCLLADADYARVTGAHELLVAGLGPDERDAVRGGTAQRIYGLEVA
ncbi:MULTISPECIES: amidohydrolase family protein [unclassified Nocardioides]|uniref:amidohydrolase family protein n=1 Tax=unclassified Nocardioides TaxID=2615069 RepID=UPI00362161F9